MKNNTEKWVLKLQATTGTAGVEREDHCFR